MFVYNVVLVSSQNLRSIQKLENPIFFVFSETKANILFSKSVYFIILGKHTAEINTHKY
jgi:hypothetical protein